MALGLPKSAIDHILFSDNNTLRSYSVQANYDSVGQTDHALLRADIEVLNPLRLMLPRSPPKIPKQVCYRSLSHPDTKREIEQALAEITLPDFDSPQGSEAVTAQFMRKVVKTVQKITRLRPPKRDGWSPQVVALEAFERALIRCLGLWSPAKDNTRKIPHLYTQFMHNVCKDWDESVRRVSQSDEHYLILIHLCSRSPLDWAITPSTNLGKRPKTHST